MKLAYFLVHRNAQDVELLEHANEDPLNATPCKFTLIALM